MMIITGGMMNESVCKMVNYRREILMIKDRILREILKCKEIIETSNSETERLLYIGKKAGLELALTIIETEIFE